MNGMSSDRVKMQYSVDYKGVKEGLPFTKKVLRQSEIVSVVSDEVSSFYISAWKDEGDPEPFYELSLLKKGKDFDLKKDPQFVLNKKSLEELLEFRRKIEVEEARLILICECGCSMFLIERMDNSIYIEKYNHGNYKASKKENSEIVVNLEDFLRMLRELQIYNWNQRGGSDGTQLS